MFCTDWSIEQKKEALLAALNRGEVHVSFDLLPDPELVVPVQFQADPALTLKFSWRYGGVQLKVDDFGIRAQLSFTGTVHPVAIPWKHVRVMAQNGSILPKPRPRFRVVGEGD